MWSLKSGGNRGRRGSAVAKRQDKAGRASRKAAALALEPLEDRLYMFATNGKWNNEQPGGPGTPLALRYSYSNLLDGGLPTAVGFGTNAQIRSAMEEALGLWTAVAPIQLTEVPDSGGPTNDPWIYIGNHPEIRIGHVAMDGTGDGNLNELAHAYFPDFWTFTFRGAVAGDLYMDDGDTWGNGATGGVDLIETAAHELGHALGIAHANGDTRDLDGDGDADCPPPTPAVMDACNASLFNGPGTSFLFQDDVNAIRSLYGTGLGFVRDASGILHVNGTGGNDSFRITSSGLTLTVSSASGSFTVLTPGIAGVSVMCRGGNDSVTIDSTPAGVGVTVEGNAGNDSVFVSSGTNGNLSRVGGNVTFNGGAGADRIALSDQAAGNHARYTLGGTSAARAGWAGATYASVETIDVFGDFGNCVYDVNSLPATSSMTIFDGNGADVVNLAPGSGNLDAVAGTVTYHARGAGVNRVELFDNLNPGSHTYTLENGSVDRPGGFGRLEYRGDVTGLHLHAGAGNNDFDVNELFVSEVGISAGDGADRLRLAPYSGTANNVHGQLFVDGQGGDDRIYVNDRNASGASDGDWTIDGTTLDKSNPDPGAMVAWTNVERLQLDGGQGGTRYTVNSLPAGTAATINAGGGDDTFHVGSPAAGAGNVDGVQSPLTLNGEGGNNTLNYNDADNAYLPLIIILPGRLWENPRGDAYTVTPTTVTRDRSAVVTYAGVQTLTVNGGTQANDFRVTPSATTAINVHGNSPFPIVVLPFPFPLPLELKGAAEGAAPAAGAGADTGAGAGDLLPVPIDVRPIDPRPFPFPPPAEQWDALAVDLGGTSGASVATGGVGSGTYTFANRMPVRFTGMESNNAPPPPPSTVAARLVFYNRSVYDGNDAAATAADDAAIAPDKAALLPGQTATFANYTSYSRGINGIMVDMAGLPASAAPTAADFAVRVGMAADASSWPAGPAPTAVSVRRGAGVGGSDRVTLTFADNAIRATWMRVTMLATANTNLAAPDVFYFGNLPGEVGNNPSAAIVNALDVSQTRATQGTSQGITGRNDFNRDGRVNALDLSTVRANLLGQIPIYSAPAGPSGAAPGSAGGLRDLLA